MNAKDKKRVKQIEKSLDERAKGLISTFTPSHYLLTEAVRLLEKSKSKYVKEALELITEYRSRQHGGVTLQNADRDR